MEVDATPDLIRSYSDGYYGRACAASGAYFACGAYYYNSGLVAVYKANVRAASVSLLQIIQPKLGYIYSSFGYSIAMDGELLVVGAFNFRPTTSSADENKGAVWILQRNSSDLYSIRGVVSPPGATACEAP